MQMAVFFGNLFDWFGAYRYEQEYVALLLNKTHELMNADNTEKYRKLPANAFKELILTKHSEIESAIRSGYPTDTQNRLLALHANLVSRVQLTTAAGTSPNPFGPIMATLSYLFAHDVETPHSGCALATGPLSSLIGLMNTRLPYIQYDPHRGDPGDELRRSIPTMTDHKNLETALNSFKTEIRSEPSKIFVRPSTGTAKTGHPATAWSSPVFESPYY